MIHKIEIELLQAPFPHAIIRNVYNEIALKEIWQELEFLTYKDKFDAPKDNGSSGIDKLTGEELAHNHGITLDSIFPKRNISNILKHNRWAFNPEVTDAFASLSPLLGHVKTTNCDITKIKYYDDSDCYLPHTDQARFTIVTYFYKEPKQFTGGDLFFEEFGYTIPLENNTAVFFTGCIKHASTPVIMNEASVPFSGNGKYTMTQFLNDN